MNGQYDKPDLLNGTNLAMNAENRQNNALDVETVKVIEPTAAYPQMPQEDNSFDYWAEKNKKEEPGLGPISKDTLKTVGFVVGAILLGFGLVVIGIVIFYSLNYELLLFSIAIS